MKRYVPLAGPWSRAENVMFQHVRRILIHQTIHDPAKPFVPDEICRGRLKDGSMWVAYPVRRSEVGSREILFYYNHGSGKRPHNFSLRAFRGLEILRGPHVVMAEALSELDWYILLAYDKVLKRRGLPIRRKPDPDLEEVQGHA